MESAPRFFGLDTVMIDVVLKVARLPTSGSDSLARERLITTGGGFNAMSAAARQGMGVTYIGQLGRGPFADIARADLRGDEIAAVVRDSPDLDLGLCVVLVEESGERTFVTAPGAEGTLTALDMAAAPVGEGDYVFLSGYNFVYTSLRDQTLAWLRRLSSGVVVAFDPGPRVLDIDNGVLREVLARADWLLCNASEASAMVREANVHDCVVALTKVSGRRGVVVRCGADGCLGALADGRVVEVVATATDVVDTNGAGDVHNGVLLAELARGTAFRDALRRANVGAALAIASFGPATCPTRDVISARLDVGR